VAVPAAKLCLDVGDALTRFDGRGTGHGAQDGLLAGVLMLALIGHENA
jgi:hypothetical protein